MKRILYMLLLTLLYTVPAHAGIGLYNFGPRVGKDVVQGDDTRTFYMVQADISTLFSPRVLWEIAAETGSGRALGGEDVEVVGGSTIFKYYWVNKRKTAYAFTGGGLGVNRFKRFEAGRFRTQYDTSVHWVLLGMEKHLRRAKGVFEVRWLLGNVEGASALRVSLGISYKIRTP